jgi:hypothetical protein
MTTSLHTLVDVEAFASAIRGGYISERKHHADDSLRIYSYTPKTQFSGHWTPETRLARGLMLRVDGDDLATAEVVGRGLPKYFTVEQVGSDWGRPKLVDDDEGVTVEDAPELSWDAPAFVADKMNGALGLAYVGPEGLAISTKGSFGSPEAQIATRWLRDHLTADEQARFVKFFEGSTALFEIITPERPHPVDYGNTEALFFLGSVAHADGRWTPAEPDHFLATELRFGVAARLEHRTLREAMEAPYRENTEGLVVTLDDERGQHLYKVKPMEYLALRKAFYATETVDLVALLTDLSSEELEALSADDLPLPVGLRNQEEKRAQVEAELLAPLREKLVEVRAHYLEVRGEELPDRGSFARAAAQSSLPVALLFKAYDEELGGKKTLAASVLKMLVKDLRKAAAAAK